MNASVVIPVKNGSLTITKTLVALSNQSLKPKEIIVVDDGSSDGTVEKIKRFKDIKLISQNSMAPPPRATTAQKTRKANSWCSLTRTAFRKKTG